MIESLKIDREALIKTLLSSQAGGAFNAAQVRDMMNGDAYMPAPLFGELTKTLRSHGASTSSMELLTAFHNHSKPLPTADTPPPAAQPPKPAYSALLKQTFDDLKKQQKEPGGARVTNKTLAVVFSEKIGKVYDGNKFNACVTGSYKITDDIHHAMMATLRHYGVDEARISDLDEAFGRHKAGQSGPKSQWNAKS